jgi:serine phosphatase RsbU (regulator of sigma subunit)
MTGATTRRRPVSLIWYLVAFIALIVGIVVASTLAVSYHASEKNLRQDFDILLDNTGTNAVESVWLVNTGLLLIDEDLDPALEGSLATFRDAYEAAGRDTGAMDLGALRDAIASEYSGKVDLYIINADGIIEDSTLQDIVGVDFRNYPDFYRQLTSIRLGSEFAADPVVRSVEDAADTTVKGTLRKFAYLPSPDHDYVFEIGIESPIFADVRSRLSYQEMAERLLAVNPDLLGIRVYDFYGNVAAQAGSPKETRKDRALQALNNRDGFSVSDKDAGTETRFVFVNLRDPAAASDASVVVELVFSTARLDAAVAELVRNYVIIGLCAILMGTLLAFVMFRKLTGAIGAIVEDVGTVAGGDLGHTIRSVDTAEFAELESGINTMIHKILLYSEALERKKAELQVAADIQQAFLPKELPPIAGFDLAALSLPAREVGGDFYDVFPVRDGNHALVIADVSGKGVPASLFMALLRTAVRIVSRHERSPTRVMEGSNTIFLEDAGSVSFVTVFYGILDSTKRRHSYVNAGHNPPLLLHRDGTMEELIPTGPVIGLVDDPGYLGEEVSLVPGDLLVMYTDGVTEALNGAGEMFGEERLKEVVRQAAGLTAAEIISRIRSAVFSFCGDVDQFDDLTLVVLTAE